MSYNLKQIKDAPTADIEIKDPETGAGLGVFFTMAGPEHPTTRALEMARQRRMREGIKKTGQLEFGDPEEDEADAREALSMRTLGWRGYVDAGGQDVAFSAAAARSLMADADLGWLRVQLQAAVNERKRFITRSVQG